MGSQSTTVGFEGGETISQGLWGLLEAENDPG